MGTIILRESRDSDLYVGWSSFSDSITVIGDRDEMVEYLWDWVVQVSRRETVQVEERRHPENLMQRCDIMGTSSYFKVKGHPLEGAWDDDGFIYQQRGFASRENLFRIARRILETDDWDVDVSDLLRPFEDDDEDD